jgi:hypothetical protein
MKTRSMWACLASGLLLTACQGDKAVAPAELSPEDVVGSVTLFPLNAIMAVGQTLQFTVSGTTATGTPTTSFDSVQYSLRSISDTIRVSVSSTGLVTARAPSGDFSDFNPVYLHAIAWKGGAAKGDEAVIQVTATGFSGATLSIQPIPPDSARLAVGDQKVIVPTVENPLTGESVPNPIMRLTHGADQLKMGCYQAFFPESSYLVALNIVDCRDNPEFPDFIRALARSGTAWVIATASVYGTILKDSVQYTLTNPFNAYAYVELVGVSAEGSRGMNVYVAPGGTVHFNNFFDSNQYPGVTLSYTIDNPAAATATDPPAEFGGTSGNVSTLIPGQSSDRKFLTPGTYKISATLGGNVPIFAGTTVNGQIIVQ